MTGCRVGVDIGGTFTDIVITNDSGETFTKKVSSTPDNYARAIVETLGGALSSAGLSIGRVREFLHGTTVGSNTILELKGGRIGLITTKGFRDILEIRNLRMPKLYDLRWDKPAPLVERYLRVVVNERIGADGSVRKPLDRTEAERAVKQLLKEKVEGIAVCLINSYANPEHEKLLGDVIAELAPNLPVSISTDILPQIKEYERTSTTVVNAYIMPIVSSYLRHLQESLRKEGMAAPMLLMQSNGGLTTAEEASRRPVTIVESGPAAGIVGAVRHSVESGYKDIISFDMGGTTAKTSIAENGEFTLSSEYSVGGGIMISSRLLTGGGYLLAVPAIDVAEVGAGGGSIVWIDPGGSVQIGPESAGASPGPLCYDRGGDRPTVTDSNVILGYLNPDHLCSGELKLNAERSRCYFEELIARPLNVDVITAAYATRQIAISNMIRAIKAVSSERGRDPRLFALFALGGNGPLFAAGMAYELGIKTILVPPSAGLFSAYGLLYADVQHHYSKMIGKLLREADLQSLISSWDELDKTALQQLTAEGFKSDEMRYQRLASMRYRGQSHEIIVALPDKPLAELSIGEMERLFGDEHERTYGHKASADEPIQLIRIQLVGKGMKKDAHPPSIAKSHTGDLASEVASRRAYFGRAHGFIDTPVLPRAALVKGWDGPCIIEEYDTTCLVPPNSAAVLDRKGNIIITMH